MVLGLAALAMAAPPGRAAEDGPGARDAFQTQVLPLLERYCIDCHSKESPEAGIVLDRFEDQAAAVKDGRTWLRVRDALEGRIMPPADEAPAVAGRSGTAWSRGSRTTSWPPSAASRPGPPRS